MTEQEFQAWIRAHGGERGREPHYESVAIQEVDEYGDPLPSRTQRRANGTKVTARDGATIIVARTPESGQAGQPDYTVVAQMDAEPEKVPTRTPEQTRNDQAVATGNEFKNAQEVAENNERSWNQTRTDQGGSGRPETHKERAEREARERQEERANQAEKDRKAAQDRADRTAAASIAQQQAELGVRQQEGAANRALQGATLAETQRANQARESRPDFLSQADSKTPNITRYDPVSGQIVHEANPNYDAVKAAAEERRAELASQIAGRQISLDEAKQSYTQWFDSNVRVPLLQSQEARARAEEKRQALEAEERRRQFAADYSLRKGQLGETAAGRATNAEISLLPYRAGAKWGEQFSSAINSLAQGGRMDTNAAAGINFTADAFQFSRPDFDKIAKQAAKQALSGLTDYRPSDEGFATADYTNVPTVNTEGMPAMPAYTPVALPAPSAGAALPPE